MTEVVPEGEPRKGLRLSQLGWAILVVMTLQALIFSSFGAWLATCAPQCGSSYPGLGLGFFGTGALLFFVGLRASQGRRVSGAIALLIEATYLATLGAGTASWRGYVSALSLPFWIAVGLAAIAVPLLITAWFSAKDKLRVRRWIGATILGVAVLVGIWWHFWVMVPYSKAWS
jgi:hypothetical protein